VAEVDWETRLAYELFFDGVLNYASKTARVFILALAATVLSLSLLGAASYLGFFAVLTESPSDGPRKADLREANGFTPCLRWRDLTYRAKCLKRGAFLNAPRFDLRTKTPMKVREMKGVSSSSFLPPMRDE